MRLLFGCNNGLGAQFALEQAGRTDIDIITCDIDEQVAQNIRDVSCLSALGALDGEWFCNDSSL